MTDHKPQSVIYSAQGNYGKLKIDDDPDYRQLWVRTDYNHKNGNGATVSLSVEMVRQLRDSLDAWLKNR